MCITKSGIKFFEETFTDRSIERVVIPVEMTRPQLEAFLEFIYTFGNFFNHKWEEHHNAFYEAGHKYEIIALKTLCRIVFTGSLNKENANEVAWIRRNSLRRSQLNLFYLFIVCLLVHFIKLHKLWLFLFLLFV